jgi:hypothetical protein
LNQPEAEMRRMTSVFILLVASSLMFYACSSGDGGGSNAKMCLEACAVAADCVTTGSTEDDWKCQKSRCVFEVCADDSDCIALTSGWTTTCTDGGGECPQNWICISVGGDGLCAFEPQPGVVECNAMQMTEIQMPAIDGSGDVAVCGNNDYTCTDGMCLAPGCTDDNDCVAPVPFCRDGTCVQCKSDADCSGGALTRCTSSGMCGCANDSECNGALTLCTSSGICGCRDDSECTQSASDKCYDGFCGCSSADVCTGATLGANTTWVCEKS